MSAFSASVYLSTKQILNLIYKLKMAAQPLSVPLSLCAFGVFVRESSVLGTLAPKVGAPRPTFGLSPERAVGKAQG